MATLTLAKKAVKMFSNPAHSKETQRHNIRAWLRSVDMLGSRWVIAEPRTKSKTQIKKHSAVSSTLRRKK